MEESLVPKILNISEIISTKYFYLYKLLIVLGNLF